MDITTKSRVGELVAKDYRTASVFKKHKIDFCCNGNRTLSEVCKAGQPDIDQLIRELNELEKVSATATTHFAEWDNDLLADYIEKKHHRYVEKKIPEIKSYLNKVARVHGQRHPELIEIEQLFTASASELLSHMQREENVLFPYIRKMERSGQSFPPSFGTVQNPIRMMMQEHDNEGARFRKINALSNDYTPPDDACTTYTVAYSLLKEFEEDLHLHIHLENNILFPQAIDAEKKVRDA